jgi:glucose/arabinose dehydrogenase
MSQRSRARFRPSARSLLLLALAACSDGTGPERVARVEIDAPAEQVELTRTVQLAATVRNAGGAALSGHGVIWSSSDETVLRVDGTGLATGLALGSALVRAAAAGERDSVRITVVPLVASVAVEPDSTTVLVGESQRLAARVRDARGADLEGQAVRWSSDDEAVARVGADGTVHALAPGRAVVTAESGGTSATAVVRVERGALPELRLERVAGIFHPSPTFLTSPPGDPRLFVGTVDGQVWIVDDGRILPEMFLDLRELVHHEGERGMYQLAFHPQFASNGYFYVKYVDHGATIHVARYRAGADPNRADPASRKAILSIPHPPTMEHFGGSMAFGPDGKLFIGVGDGGHGHGANAQDRSTLLGKLLRIDVDGGDPYAVPADNPFARQAASRGEIWALGLRNPWRLAFDHQAGLLYVADVGETHWEEVNVVRADQGGQNYGWPRLEGSHCFPAGTTGCDRSGLTLPALEYPHPNTAGAQQSAHPAGCAVTGGYVYRGGRMPALRGHYFYGDLCQGWVRSFRYEEGQAADQRQWLLGATLPAGERLPFLVSFGQDSSGELYVLPYSGIVYRIVPDAAPAGLRTGRGTTLLHRE